MSFICDMCQKPQPAHSKPNKVVVRTRPKLYPERYKYLKGNPRPIKIDNGGKGWEIARERIVCDSCKALLEEAEK